MKTIYSFAILVAIMSVAACESSKIPKKPTENFKTVSFSSMTELSHEDARRMIDFVADREARHNHASAKIANADLVKLGSIADVTVRFVRAYYYNYKPTLEHYAQPTMIVAISTDSESRYFMVNEVCPPPDASTCMEGLYFTK